MTRLLLCAAVMHAAGLGPASAAAPEAFQPGRLLATSWGRVYMIEPETGHPQKLIDLGMEVIFGDIVYNAATASAFVVNGADAGGDTIFEIRWTGPGTYALLPYLTGLTYASGLAVDSRGRLYFNMYQRIYRSDPLGQTDPVPVTEYDRNYLFTARWMSLSTDQSRLFVSRELDGVDVVQLPDGSLSHLPSTEPLFWSGGVDVSPNGTVYVTQQHPGHILAVAPDGAASTHCEKGWMSSGAFSDLEFDDETGALYVQNATRIYTIGSDGSDRLLCSFDLSTSGLDLVDPPKLQIARSEDNAADVVLSWMAPEPDAYILQRRASLRAGDWTDAPGTPVAVPAPGGRSECQQAVAAEGLQQFFRLRQRQTEE